jgi:hypothetical protein
MTRKIDNPDNLPPYWTEIGYYSVTKNNSVFRRKVASGPAPILVCAEQFHENRRENLRRVLEKRV